MSQLTNNISLYKKIDSNLAELAGITFEEPVFKYSENLLEKVIKIEEPLEGLLKVNDHDIDWSPSEHNLKVVVSIKINNPSILFGSNGVTSEGNKIGVAVHLHSRSSNNQKKIKIGTIDYGFNPIIIPFEQNFPVGTIRGTIFMKYFLYLESMNSDVEKIQANQIGMVLTEENLYEIEIQVDGDGSIFPIGEFADPKGPLWDFNRYWQDASLDSFDASNVSIRLNTLHPLFQKIKGGKLNASRMLMNEIMIQAISIIINEVLNVDEVEMPTDGDAPSDTILHAVNYWVKTFEVDTTNYISIMNSVRRKLESTLGEPDKND